MNMSFYSATVAAGARQTQIDTLANNIANVNTTGYKKSKVGFVDLIYQNMDRPEDQPSPLKVGSGIRVEKTDIDFEPGMLKRTGYELDYAILGEGFFAVKDPADGEVYYTRNGSFGLSQFNDEEFYMVSDDGYRVLGWDGNPVVVDDPSRFYDEIGIYDFQEKEGMLYQGHDLFLPSPKNGQAFLQVDSVIRQGAQEGSNVQLANEITTLIESQRAYQYALKMVQTSDEVEETINNLR